MLLSIIIPVFDRPWYTKACIDSILANKPQKSEIIIVDNGSSKPTVDVLLSYNDQVRVVRNNSNLGMARAMNAGTKAASGQWLMFMHNDCIVGRGWDTYLAESMSQMQAMGIRMASPMTNYAAEGTFVDHGLMKSFLKRKPSNKTEPLVEHINKIIRKTYSKHEGLDAMTSRRALAGKARLVDVSDEISMFCILSKKEDIEYAGGISEIFGLRGCEEKELADVVWSNGMRLGRLNSMYVHHFGNITSDGHGMSFPQLMQAAEKILAAARGERAGRSLPAWTAVIFPDRSNEANKMLLRSIELLDHKPAAIVAIPPPGIFPEKKAWEWALPLVRTEFVMQLDGDMILDQCAPRVLLEGFSGKKGMVCALLNDPFIGKTGHVKMWRTKLLNDMTSKLTDGFPDYSAVKLSESLGYEIQHLPSIIGTHNVSRDPWTAFSVFFRKGRKLVSKEAERGPRSRSDIVGAETEPIWGRIGLVGFDIGILPREQCSDPHCQVAGEEAWGAYRPVRRFCESIAADDAIYPLERIGVPSSDRIRVAFCSSEFMLGGQEKCMLDIMRLMDTDKTEPILITERNIHPYLASEMSRHRIRHVAMYENGFPTRDVRENDWLRLLGVLRPHIVVGGLKGEFYRPAYLLGIPIIERTAGWSGYSRVPKTMVSLVVTQYEKFRIELLADPAALALPDRTINLYMPILAEEYEEKPKDAARRRLGIREGAGLVVCMPARISPVKNIPMAIKAMAIVVQNGIDAELHISGLCQAADDKAKLLELAKELGISSKVFIREPLPPSDMSWFMSAADVVALSSDTEGTPGALVEAMFLNKPIVATKVGGIPEAVGEDGFIVEPNDDKAMASAIIAAAAKGTVVYKNKGRHDSEAFKAAWQSQVLERVYKERYGELPYGRSKIGVAIRSALGPGAALAMAVKDAAPQGYDVIVFSCVEGNVPGCKVVTHRGPSEWVDEQLGAALIRNDIDVLVLGDHPSQLDSYKPTHIIGSDGRATISVPEVTLAPYLNRHLIGAIVGRCLSEKKIAKVTFIMPVRDRHEYVEHAIGSILGQTCKDWNLIVVSDGKWDERVLKAAWNASKGDDRISFVSAPRCNQNSAINFAARMSKTAYISRLDDDDAYAPTALSVMLSEVAFSPEVSYFYGSYKHMNVAGEVESHVHVSEDFSPERLEEWYIANGLLLWKRRDFLQYGGLPEDMECAGDYLFALTAMAMGCKFKAIKEPLMIWRTGHADRITAKFTASENKFFIDTARRRYAAMKGTLGLSWVGEPPSSIAPRTWRLI